MVIQVSGQAINLQKSDIFCSRSTYVELRATMAQILGVREVLGVCKYLGLPSRISRSKKPTFKYVKDRIWNRIGSWSKQCLSQAGKDVLIKSALQFIPSYVMSVFFCQELM